MATRLYLSNATAPVTPANGTFYSTGEVWETPTPTPSSALLLMRSGNFAASTYTTFAGSESSATNAQDACIRRFVSDPLVGAQTISGTLKGQARMSQSANTMNALTQIMAKVVSNDGATLRGVLYGGDSRTTNVDEITTTLRNQQVPAPGVTPVTLSSVSALDTDRIVVEVGVRANNTSATAFTCSLRVGTSATAGGANDLSEGGTETTDLNPWVEFSQNLAFEATVSMGVANVASAGRTSSVVPGGASVAMDMSALASFGRALSAVAGATSSQMDPANLTLLGRVLTVAGQDVVVVADVASLGVAARQLLLEAGAAVISADSALLETLGTAAIITNVGGRHVVAAGTRISERAGVGALGVGRSAVGAGVEDHPPPFGTSVELSPPFTRVS